MDDNLEGSSLAFLTVKETSFWHGPDCTSGMALLCISEEEPHCFLGEWREDGLEVFGDCAEMSCTEGKVGAE